METSTEFGTYLTGCGRGEGEMWPPSCGSGLQPCAKDSSNATCHRASGTRTWKLSWSRLGNCTHASRGGKSPSHHVRKQRSVRLLRSRVVMAPRALVQLALLMATMAVVLRSNWSEQLQWQDLGNRFQPWPHGVQFMSQQQPQQPQQPCTQSILDIRNSPAVAMKVEPWSSTISCGEPKWQR